MNYIVKLEKQIKTKPPVEKKEERVEPSEGRKWEEEIKELKDKAFDCQQKNFLLEKQLKDCRRILEEESRDERERQLFLQNAVLGKEMYELQNKANLQHLHIENLIRKSQLMSEKISSLKLNEEKMKRSHQQTRDELFEEMEQKNLELVNTVDYGEYLKIQSENFFLKEDLKRARIERLENQEILNHV